jgi:hypothetical protein
VTDRVHPSLQEGTMGADSPHHASVLTRRAMLRLFGVVLGTGTILAQTPVAFGAGGSSSTPPAASRAPLPKSDGTWILSRNQGSIRGFADRVSAAPGQTVALFVDTPAPTLDAEAYRVGWYDGGQHQARLIGAVRGMQGIVQPHPTEEAGTGLISAARWHQNGQLTIGDWPTGLYAIKLIAANGDESYLPLVVRDDARHHDYLFQHGCTTDQAYNNWGGRSLYDFNSAGAATASGTRAAVKVSYDRPYAHITGLGQSFQWELPMIRYLDANGFDVGYVSDLDVHADPSFADRARAVIQAGHSEYWSHEMRNHLEAAHQANKGLGFFTGDTGSWAIRFENSTLGANRVQVCYRDAGLDPITQQDSSHATVAWYQSPLNRPIQRFLGIGTNGQIARSASWTVNGVSQAPDIFAGTGLHDGDTVSNLTGYEYDGIATPGADDAPDGLLVLGSAKVNPLRPSSGALEVSAINNLVWGQGPAAGTLDATMQSNDGSASWQIEVQLESTEDGDRSLVYGGPPAGSGLSDDGSTTGVIPVPNPIVADDWTSFTCDLVGDYTSTFGSTPPDLQVLALKLRGSLAVEDLTLTAPDGTQQALGLSAGQAPGDAGWGIVSGSGTLTADTAADGSPVLTLRPNADRRDDVSHTVLVRPQGAGPIVAVGSIQWSWALDDFGTHVDVDHNATPVDPRVQALTGNLLKLLRG